MADLDLSVVIETILGPLELEDPEGGYEIHAESFGQLSVSHRKLEVPGDWSEGADVDRSLRDNVNETLSVWVGGPSHYAFRVRLDALTAALGQLSYTITKRIEDAQEVWHCLPSDYTIETSQPFMAAKVGLVKATVSRKPAATLSQVAP